MNELTPSQLSPAITPGRWRITAMMALPRNTAFTPATYAQYITASLRNLRCEALAPPQVDVIAHPAGDTTLSCVVDVNASAAVPEGAVGRVLLSDAQKQVRNATGYRTTATLDAVSPVMPLLRLIAPQTSENALNRVWPRRVVISVGSVDGPTPAPPISTSIVGSAASGVGSTRVSTDPVRSGDITAAQAASAAAGALAGFNLSTVPVWAYVVGGVGAVALIAVATLAIRKAL